MKRINLLWILWIFVISEFKAIYCVSYPGVYRNEPPVIIPGASPIENVFVTERYGLNYECIETCYPILNICGELCNIRPDLPECAQCHRLPSAQPTPIIIETPPYEPRPPIIEYPLSPSIPNPSRPPRPNIPRPTVPRMPNFRTPPRPILPNVPRPIQFDVYEPELPILPNIPGPPEYEIFKPVLPPQFTSPEVPRPPVFEVFDLELPPQPMLIDIPRPPIFEPKLPRQPMLPDIPKPPIFQPELPSQPMLPDTPRPVVYEPQLPPQSMLPDVPRPPLFEPELPQQPMLPNIPRPPKYEQELPTQPMLPDVPQPLFEPELPPQPVLPEVPLPSAFELLEFDLPSQPLRFEVFEPELLSQPILYDVRPPPMFEVFELDEPPRPFLPDIPSPPVVKIFDPELPPQFILPEVPEFEPYFPTQPYVLDIPRPPVYELFQPDLPPQPIFPDVPSPPTPEIYELEFLSEPSPMIPEVDLPQVAINELPVIQPTIPEVFIAPNVERPEYFEPSYPNYPIPPRLEETFSPEFIELNPDSLRLPEMIPQVTEIEDYDTGVAGLNNDKDNLQPPVNLYQDICNDYCLLKRNSSECEICLRTGVPADDFDLCSNCLVTPSEPGCELCYPILLNLCREFCIFEDNEPDCSICYPQPTIEPPPEMIFNQESTVQFQPFLPTQVENVPIIQQPICPEYCVLTPTSPECTGCVIGVEVMEKICIDICSGYCLDNPENVECAACYPESIDNNQSILIPEEIPTLEVINYQCCYGEYCAPMPRNGMCPVVCKEPCTTACSNDCFNPTCSDCQEVVAINEHRRTQFMIWLKSKLSDMKSRYMAMIEACIRRTELMYERELQAIEFLLGLSSSYMPCLQNYPNVPSRRMEYITSGDLKNPPDINSIKNHNKIASKPTYIPPIWYMPPNCYDYINRQYDASIFNNPWYTKAIAQSNGFNSITEHAPSLPSWKEPYPTIDDLIELYNPDRHHISDTNLNSEYQLDEVHNQFLNAFRRNNQNHGEKQDDNFSFDPNHNVDYIDAYDEFKDISDFKSNYESETDCL